MRACWHRREWLLALASTAIALGIGEGAIRVLGHYQGIDYGRYLRELTNAQRLPSAIWADRRSGALWQHYPPFRPGVQALALTSEFSVLYQINDQGLRDGEHTYAKPADVARVLALGDSQTFGVGVPYGARYTEIPERHLSGLEIVNMGVPGYGVDHALLAYLAEGRRYHPDAVLLFVHVAMTRRNWTRIYADGRVRIPSDVATAPPRERSDAETAYLGHDDPLFAGGSHPVLRHSHLLSFAWYRIQLWRLHARLRADDERSYRPVPSGRSRAHLQDHDPLRRRRTTALLARLAAECRNDGVALIVVNIDDHYGLGYVGEVSGLEFLDLSVDLHRRNLERGVRYAFDRHYTPETHAYIGERLTEWLDPKLRALRGRASRTPHAGASRSTGAASSTSVRSTVPVSSRSPSPRPQEQASSTSTTAPLRHLAALMRVMQ